MHSLSRKIWIHSEIDVSFSVAGPGNERWRLNFLLHIHLFPLHSVVLVMSSIQRIKLNCIVICIVKSLPTSFTLYSILLPRFTPLTLNNYHHHISLIPSVIISDITLENMHGSNNSNRIKYELTFENKKWIFMKSSYLYTLV